MLARAVRSLAVARPLRGSVTVPVRTLAEHTRPPLTTKVLDDYVPNINDTLSIFVDGKKAPSAKLLKLADEIETLTMLELADLSILVQEKFGFTDAEMQGSGAAAAAPAAAAEAKPVAAPVVEKTHFDLKLTSFDAAQKLKVIKEVRAATNLGLKEAKELVEGAPAVLAKNLKKSDAEALIAKLKEVGGVVVME